jgi:beta-glucanase (GH16 family)
MPIAVVVLAGGIRSATADWQLVWSDEFDGTNVDTTKWAFDLGDGGWGNSELEYYTSRTNNARIEDGQLVIEARQESYSGSSYTSARLLTKGKWSWTYGRIEARIKIPRGQGLWPAFWMLGANIGTAGWPTCGEIDIMENIGREPTIVHGTAHGPGYSGGNGIGGPYSLPGGAAFADDFHIYAVEWTTNQIKWFVDGHQYFMVAPANLPNGTTWVFTQPQFVLLNVAVGGSWPGNPDGTTTFPQRMTVDYVRVYDYVPAVVPPDAPTGLTVSPGNAKVYLNWDASTSGATGYNVKRTTRSGGSYTTVASPATNSYLDADITNCASYYYVVSATNTFGESTNSIEKSAALGAFTFAVNAGGSAAGQFVADANFTGGTQAAAVTSAIDTSGVVAPAPQTVYQTERHGNFTYTFAGLTPGVNYKVRLHFAETYWTSVGKRRFKVSINGSQVLTNFDIIAVAGAPNKATIQEFMATANSGKVVLQYATVTDNAKASGIEILLPAPATPAGLTANAGESQVTLSWSPSTGTVNYNVKRSLVSDGPYTPAYGGLTSTNYTDLRLTNGTTYYYVVSAVAAGCESADCAQVSATPAYTLPVLVSIQSSNNDLAITWPTGRLQSATNITGPWADVPEGASPWPLLSAAPQQFYRVKLP